MKGRTRVAAALILSGLLVFLWAVPAFAATYATIFGGWLRLRSYPSYESAVLTSYPSGTVVTVLGQSVGWARVRTPDARTGYMDVRYLRFGSAPTATPRPTATPTQRTWTTVNRTAWIISWNGRDVRMRSTPSVEEGNVMGLYPVGRAVTQIRISNDGWSYIRIDGKHGYMMTEFLQTSTPAYPTPTPVITAQPYWPPTAQPYWPPTAQPYWPPTAQPYWPTSTPVPTATPTPTPTPVPTATPGPIPGSPEITSVKIKPYQPKVGDKIQVYLRPEEAQYTCVWYNEAGMLLSTSQTYKVRAVDVGHVIHVRIQGTGIYTGFVADGTTAMVKAAP